MGVIKEFRLTDKVTNIMGKLGFREQRKRLESDRASARIANECSQELNKAVHAFLLPAIVQLERHMAKFIHETIKEELK